ncbi:MAG: AAA family ATPase [Methanobrevibacter sp.]|jgi:hypothetical protein|nr:AAA family ATPase [Methanobrevibacter sp.]
MQKLPLGRQDFKVIREKNYLYIDKTKYIYEMIETGDLYFLSRPRRFGKSLLLSTIEEVFKGNKKLFKGLYIYDKWNWDKNNPVIKIDFVEGNFETKKSLEDTLKDSLDDISEDYSIELKRRTIPTRFGELIKKINEKTGKKVVILIDEYDKAILDNIKNKKLAEDIRDVLSNFYGVMKTNDEYIEFIFITGVSKFSKTSIFSGLNNITDLTEENEYGMICGYSQKELETQFQEQIGELSNKYNLNKEKTIDSIKKWYDGYSWNGKDFVYNPYSILSLFRKKEFKNYWFQTGTPTFLMDLIKNEDMDIYSILNEEIKIFDSFPTFEIENIDLTTVLLQTGYLTIKDKKSDFEELTEYTLSIPNKEVHDSLYTHILAKYTYKTVNNIKSIIR